MNLQLFTDTGQYVLRMDAVEGNSRGLTLDERAVALACAVSIDFDFFSRHSSHGAGGFFPFPFFGFGGGDEARDNNGEAPPPTDTTPPPQYPSQPPPPPTASDTGYGDVWAEDAVDTPEDDDQGFLAGWKNLTGGDDGDDEWF